LAQQEHRSLLRVLFGSSLLGLGGSLELATLNTAGTTATEGRVQGEVNVALRIHADAERGNVHNLLANTKEKNECYGDCKTDRRRRGGGVRTDR
jgi:hypothetical protein